MPRAWYTKKYQVVFIDEYNNMTEIGWFDKLKDAEPTLNELLKGTILQDGENDGQEAQFGADKPLGELREYPSTMGYCFDRMIDAENGLIQVRGFIREDKTSSKENSRDKTTNRLKDCSMDLHDWEICLFNTKVNAEGRFETEQDEMLFKELGKTRKHIESLLYILEKYTKRK